jgi:hypothetical protein
MVHSAAVSARARLVAVAMLVIVGQNGRVVAAPPSESGRSPTGVSPQQPHSDGQPNQSATAESPSPWLILPVVSSNPKLGTAGGVFGAFLRTFDPGSRVSLFGMVYQYTSTHSSIAAAFARTSFGADHHRIVAVIAGGLIKNDYEDYLGTGEPLQTNDDFHAFAGRYLYRLKGDWFVGTQGAAANYQVLGESAEDQAVLETLGVRGFESAGVGAVVLHDSRDNEDMPSRGWYLSANNFAYRERLGGSASYDAYRVDLRAFWQHGGGHVLAFRQNNWLTDDAPTAAQASVVLRGYKLGEYLRPYMSSLEIEERLRVAPRVSATFFAGVAGLYGEHGESPGSRQDFPAWGGGVQFIVKPAQKMLANLEYAQGVDAHRGVYLKFGYAW